MIRQPSRRPENIGHVQARVTERREAERRGAYRLVLHTLGALVAIAAGLMLIAWAGKTHAAGLEVSVPAQPLAGKGRGEHALIVKGSAGDLSVRRSPDAPSGGRNQ
ncbi:hypothetical protein ACFONG_12505 [Uliginosibacterium paludis]|uniref:Uncharacterized protein n=1 Tax=Uliginosibacterium paludis TaxID=1615952 RepID=A0ABV2CQ93_9RHOO